MYSTIPLLFKSEISSFKPASVTVQAGLSDPVGKPNCWFSHVKADIVYERNSGDVNHLIHACTQNIKSVWDMYTYFILTPMDFLKACVSASVLPISRENISLPAILVNGVSVPRAWAIPKISKYI